ncbi:hypothetical protein C8Q78DRAFT_1021800 [Trametes maxima]|nr:hypothetical protein C8Q78DRAFT_1021800 [Trametes maxima]
MRPVSYPSMGDLRCVRFDDLASVLEALEPYDDAFMNLCTGALHESFHLQKAEPAQAASEPTYFFCLYTAEDLLLLLAHSPKGSTLVCPLEAEHLMTPELVEAAVHTLANALFAISTNISITTVGGHQGATNAFLMAWASLASTHGSRLRLLDPLIVSRSSYATRDTVLPLPTLLPDAIIAQASDNDFEELFPQWLAFTDCTAGRRSLGVEETHLRREIASGLAWTCRVGDELVGFVINGRATPHTLAIKNVYVPPEHRRKGYAEAMVRAMSRHYLGVLPVGYGVSADPPAVGLKDAICINVMNPAAERVYRRAGFLFPEYDLDGKPVGGYDPATGRKGWFLSVLRGLQPEEGTS